MIHLFINALAASAGGGVTYIRNVLPQLAARDDVQTTVALSPALRRELPPTPRMEFLELDAPVGSAQRFLFEQRRLPRMIRDSKANILLAAGNFALWTSPVPQILLSRNALYTSSDFLHDLHRRHEFGLWLDTKVKAALAAASIRKANLTVAPSEAFAADLRKWTGANVVCVHHGFDYAAFRSQNGPAPTELAAKLANPQARLRLLFVSHYNYYRNFETLFRTVALLKKIVPEKGVQLVLTCRLISHENPGSYRADSAAGLLQELGIEDSVLTLGAVPYPLLHHVYRACDIYITPAYAESFAHPLVEAMSSGLPVVASDLRVHREICEDAALYFPRFSPQDAANAVAELAQKPLNAKLLSERGLERATNFSWRRHLDQILAIAGDLTKTAAKSAQHAA